MSKMNLESFFKHLQPFGQYVKKCANVVENAIEQSLETLEESQIHDFAVAFGTFTNNAFLRGIDVEVGDNIALLSSYVFTRDNIQNQLNRHHFGNATKSLSQSTAYASLENYFNVHTIRNVCDRNVAVLSDRIMTVPDPMHLTNAIRDGKYSLVTIMDFKNVTKSLEGILMFSAGFTVNDFTKKVNTLLLVVNQCTRASTPVPRNERISPLTRNGNEYTLDARCGLVIVGYEGCVMKLKKMANAGAVDNLTHQLSRYMAGIPTASGMSFFDIVNPQLHEIDNSGIFETDV